ncbi:MAG TPA: DUF4349 domain-containing protein [Pyrinomonadaceae bacterium]|nr:DUF4349 domain-containing protein [Pyrinomonadaceae bacterium]
MMETKFAAFLLLISVLAFGACSSDSQNNIAGIAKNEAVVRPSSATQALAELNNEVTSNTSQAQRISLEQTANAQNVPAANERKIIRNANLTLETNSPEETGRRVASIAESKGGFVVSSDTQQKSGANNSQATTVNLTIRIPAAQFDAALSEIRGTASRVVQEKVTGQDVTEEFIDLEAGLRTKKALEAQFLEILKQAKTVDDALSVQTQIAEVRGEIEKLEGRRKFLENQTSLSTVTISIRTPEVFAAGSTGFFSEVWRAVSDGVTAALAIILGLIRIVLALLPLLILFGLPLYFLVRYLRRKTRREKLAAQFAEEKH